MLKTLNFLVGCETVDMEQTVQNVVPGYRKPSLAIKDAVPKTLLLQVVFHMELIGGLQHWTGVITYVIFHSVFAGEFVLNFDVAAR